MTFNVGQKLRASDLNPGAWQRATLQNGWTNRPGYQLASYRLLTPYLLQLQFNIAPGTKTDGTILFSVPAGFIPTSTATLVVSGGSLPAATVEVDPSGNAKCFGASTATFLQISQIIPLDL